MIKKKEAFVALGVACIAIMSLSVLVYAATWTPEQLADWMFKTGRHKIWTTNYEIVNHIRPKVDDIQDKMGQGLVGESKEGNVDTIMNEWVTISEYKPPHPKKYSLYIDSANSVDGDAFWVFMKLEMHGTWRDLKPYYWENIDDAMQENLHLVLDQLPVDSKVWVAIWQAKGKPFTLYWMEIIEEL